jgi:hypothetical protein
MVARIVSGKSIRGILNYNEYKVQDREAELLLAASFPRPAAELKFKSKLERFEKLTCLNERTRTNALHISLNFSNRDVLDSDLLCRIAGDYMEAIGFGDQPYLVYRHYDAAHPHIHIATVNIDPDGNRIETHNIGRYQSEKARKELEEKYNLTRAEDQKQETAFMLRPALLEKAVYGKRETKLAISSIVREVVGTYRFTSLPELNAVLGQFNVMAYPGAEGTMMREKGGLVYCLLNDRGEPVGIPIKASSIYSSPTLKSLERKYPANKEERKPFGLRLKHQLDKAIKGADSEAALMENLKKQGIRILMRTGVNDQVYGVTFIDNATRTVFNGSDLGKEYSAKAFIVRIAFPAKQSTVGRVASDQKEYGPGFKNAAKEMPVHPASSLPVLQKIIDVALDDEHEYSLSDPYRKKKRKKKVQPE